MTASNDKTSRSVSDPRLGASLSRDRSSGAMACRGMIARTAVVLLAMAGTMAQPSAQHVEHTQLTAADGTADDYFGWSMALDGDTLVIGAPQRRGEEFVERGAAYVFTRAKEGWKETTKLTASDGASGLFGHSVAVDGDTLIVGARGSEIGDNPFQGAAYVFTRTGDTWTETAKLVASDGTSHDEFGAAVAIEGDTLVVGAYGAPRGSRLGAVYVFAGSGSAWTETAKLVASDSAGRLFGASVAFAEDTLLVGAPGWSDGYEDIPGSAYVFERSGDTWTETARLLPTNSISGDKFGRSVALATTRGRSTAGEDGGSQDTGRRDTLVVGAAGGYTLDGRIVQGAAYVFSRSGNDWAQSAKLVAGDAISPAQDNFGSSVALDGERLVVGASNARATGGHGRQGAAYVFTRTKRTWIETAKLIASDPDDQDWFGGSLGVDRGTLVVAAPLAGISGNSDQGAAYVFEPYPSPDTQDVFVLEDGRLRNPSARTRDGEPLFNLEGAPLPITWGKWTGVRGESIARCDNDRTTVLITLEGLVPNGVYSLFYTTLGPDSENPICPNIERSLPLYAARPCMDGEQDLPYPFCNQPDAASFIADRYGRMLFMARVDGCLLDAVQLSYQVVYHADGQTYGDLPNRREFETQGPLCRDSWGTDAMRQLQILQK